MFIGVPIFLLYWYVRLLLGHVFDILIIIAILIFGYIARNEGYVKQVSPKVRRVECMVCGGLFTGFATLTVESAPRSPPSISPLLPALPILIVVGVYVGDKVGRKLKMY